MIPSAKILRRRAPSTREASGLGGDLGVLLLHIEVARVAVDIVARRLLALLRPAPNVDALPSTSTPAAVGQAAVVLRPSPQVGTAPRRDAVRDTVASDRPAIRLVEGVVGIRVAGIPSRPILLPLAVEARRRVLPSTIRARPLPLRPVHGPATVLVLLGRLPIQVTTRSVPRVATTTPSIRLVGVAPIATMVDVGAALANAVGAVAAAIGATVRLATAIPTATRPSVRPVGPPRATPSTVAD